MEHATAELLFGEKRVLLAASHLVGSIAQWVVPAAEVSYFHLLLGNHDIVMSNGRASESLQLSPRLIAGMSHQARKSLSDVLTGDILLRLMSQPDACRGMKKYEAKALTTQIFLERVLARTCLVPGQRKVIKRLSPIDLIGQDADITDLSHPN